MKRKRIMDDTTELRFDISIVVEMVDASSWQATVGDEKSKRLGSENRAAIWAVERMQLQVRTWLEGVDNYDGPEDPE